MTGCAVSCENSCLLSVLARGVQYVHCVMHKGIMVKVWGKENHIKHVQNTEILPNQWTFGKVGGMKEFSE